LGGQLFVLIQKILFGYIIKVGVIMGGDCALCDSPAESEYIPLIEWTQYLQTEYEIDVPGTEIRIPTCRDCNLKFHCLREEWQIRNTHPNRTQEDIVEKVHTTLDSLTVDALEPVTTS
jgi:hypothetical protein